MRFFLACFLACSFLVEANLVLAAGEDEWVGFWRLEQKSEPKSVVFHLWVSSDGRPHFFDVEWKELELASGSGFEGDSLKLSQYLKGGQVVWSGQRNGDLLQGNWEFLHFQYRQGGSFSGTRDSRIALENWGPLEAAETATSAEGIVNLTGLLLDKANDEEGFRDYWENVFVPQFLPFLADCPEVSVLWATLNNDAEMAAFRDVYENVTRLRGLLNTNFPQYSQPFRIVIAPFGEQHRRAVMADNPFLLINPTLFLEGIERDKLGISKKILETQLHPYTRQYQRESGSVFKMGLTLFLLHQAYPDELTEILGVKEKRLVQLEKQLPRFKEKMAGGQKLKEDERRFLSFCFARALATTFPFNGVLKSPPQEIVKRLVEYLHLTPEEAAGGESAEETAPQRDSSHP